MNIYKSIPVTINNPTITYELLFGENLFKHAFEFAKSCSMKPILITTNDIQDLLPKCTEDKIILPQGENLKSRLMKEKIEDALIERGCGKESCLIAVGGGVILDLVGFVASTYCRGIPYISMPISLVAMADGCLGGKTAINVEEVTNWIGSFHHPLKVFIDFSLIHTLPHKEFLYGLAEPIKHGLVANSKFVRFLDENSDAILQRDFSTLKELIVTSCETKRAIVEKDPYEKGKLRRILNFGHTIGHALETLSNYRRSHGQAVIMGMKLEAAIAKRLDYLSAQSYDYFCNFIKKFPFVLDYPSSLPYEMLCRNKKGSYKFVVLNDIGSVDNCNGEYVATMTKEMFRDGWKDVVC